ncbi:MAG: sigma-54-dependent Fis family transcriptional regulator, partial [bacterium (Candidatus Stahlbacteria) CG23_combo_of_CG06-09_8_20_14_all_34_7]
TIPEELLESELFGAVRGAYTGSYENRDGRLKLSEKGTLYLDNIDNADLRTQARLVRFVQEKSYFPLGASKEVKVDARIISSVSSDLKNLIETKKLREDLLFRLNVYVIKIPPITERREDIELIAKYYIKKMSKELNINSSVFNETLINDIKGFDWKGNEREIVNFIERTLITGKSDFLLHAEYDKNNSLKNRMKKLKQDFEKKEIQNALKISKNNKSEAARKLKISYRNLMEKIKEYKIEE